MIAKLIADNQVLATFTLSKYEKHTVEGDLREVVSWNGDGTPYEEEFIANAMIKWDGCSHFWFYGHDSDKGDKDSYYHICGVSGYINFMRILAFAYNVMASAVGDNLLEKEEYQELQKMNLLDGCEIVFERNMAVDSKGEMQ